MRLDGDGGPSGAAHVMRPGDADVRGAQVEKRVASAERARMRNGHEKAHANLRAQHDGDLEDPVRLTDQGRTVGSPLSCGVEQLVEGRHAYSHAISPRSAIT